MDIVTGYRGEPHVTSNDHQAFNYGALGDCILPVGEKLRGELVTEPGLQLRIHDGEIIHKGVHSRVKPGTYDTVALSNGSQNMKRIDLVCVKYSKAQNNVENSEWVVKHGTPTSGTPATPSHINGNVIGGQTVDETPVFKVEYDGLNAVVSSLLSVSMTVSDISSRINGKKEGSNIYKNKIPIALECGTRVFTSGTASDDITLYTVPAGIEISKIVADVTNGDIATWNTQMISTYINTQRRTVHAKLNASRIPSYYRFNYIIWYFGEEGLS